MGYERYPRGTQPGDYYNRGDDMDYGRDYGNGRDFSYSSARDYESAGEIGGGSRNGGDNRYGRDQNNREQYGRGNRDYYGGRQMNQGYGRDRDAGDAAYHGSYTHDGRRFEDVGQYRHADDDNRRDRPMNRQGNRPNGGYGRQPEGYDYQDRGFVARAGDEVRSWFGDDDAERRRQMDARYDERDHGDRNQSHRDADYHSWRSGQIAALDRDYDEYRQENQSKFHNEFSSWRSNRQTQRESLNKVQEHAEVTGSDGEHVGTVDKVRDDRILLTKNDKDAGGVHHSIPSSWIKQADEKKVTLSKTAAEAKKAWQDEDRNSAMSGWGDNRKEGDVTQGRTLDRSFSGTY